MQVFMMLPVLLLGMVPALHRALVKIVHGVHLLLGRVISERVRRTKGSVLPLTHALTLTLALTHALTLTLALTHALTLTLPLTHALTLNAQI